MSVRRLDEVLRERSVDGYKRARAVERAFVEENLAGAYDRAARDIGDVLAQTGGRLVPFPIEPPVVDPVRDTITVKFRIELPPCPPHIILSVPR